MPRDFSAARFSLGHTPRKLPAFAAISRIIANLCPHRHSNSLLQTTPLVKGILKVFLIFLPDSFSGRYAGKKMGQAVPSAWSYRRAKGGLSPTEAPPFLFPSDRPGSGMALLFIGFSFHGQQPQKLLKQRGIGGLKHDPLSIVVGFRLVVEVLNLFGKSLPARFKSRPLLFP